MSSLAERFFSERELNDGYGIGSADELWAHLRDGYTFAQSPSTGNVQMYFRGQSDSSWGLSSSLYRCCRGARTGAITELTVSDAERAVLLAAKGLGLGRWMTDLQLLTVLQHHRYPTRFIDVSDGTFEALFFALDDDSNDGRLFLLRPAYLQECPAEAPHEDVLQVGASVPVPWPDESSANLGVVPEWSERITLLRRPNMDLRMFAQRGSLLAGGLPTPAAVRTMTCAGAALGHDEWYDITTLGFEFPGSGALASDAWAGAAWTIRVKKEWKPKLRDLLAGWTYPITKASLFPEIDDPTSYDQVRAAAIEAARLSI